MDSWTDMTLAMSAITQMTAGGMTTSPNPASAAGTASSWQKPFKGLCHCLKPSKSWRFLIRSLTGRQVSVQQQPTGLTGLLGLLDDSDFSNGY